MRSQKDSCILPAMQRHTESAQLAFALSDAFRLALTSAFLFLLLFWSSLSPFADFVALEGIGYVYVHFFVSRAPWMGQNRVIIDKNPLLTNSLEFNLKNKICRIQRSFLTV